MTAPGGNVAPFPNGDHTRLAVVERDVAEAKAAISAFDQRLRVVEGDIREIKTQLQHVATRAWVLGGVLGGMGVAAGIAVAIVRWLT
ncbi:MAG: hypothetical protein OXF93_15580 [Acidobacteria bacterium]|nr:hypothetical protein [Acidobacteriota bacterium]